MQDAEDQVDDSRIRQPGHDTLAEGRRGEPRLAGISGACYRAPDLEQSSAAGPELQGTRRLEAAGDQGCGLWAVPLRLRKAG